LRLIRKTAPEVVTTIREARTMNSGVKMKIEKKVNSPCNKTGLEKRSLQ
jgi:hypothetical protein